MPPDQKPPAGGSFTAEPKPISQSVETVVLDVGRFENCLRLDYEGPISGKLPNGLAIEAGTLKQTVWYAQGVGQVQVEQMQVLEFRLPDETSAKSVETKKQRLVRYVK